MLKQRMRILQALRLIKFLCGKGASEFKRGISKNAGAVRYEQILKPQVLAKDCRAGLKGRRIHTPHELAHYGTWGDGEGGVGLEQRGILYQKHSYLNKKLVSEFLFSQ